MNAIEALGGRDLVEDALFGCMSKCSGADGEVGASDRQLYDAIGIMQPGVDQLNESGQRVKVRLATQIV